MRFFLVFILYAAYMRFEIFVFDDNIVFLREFFEFIYNLRGMRHVYDENSEKHSDDEGESEVVGKPHKRVEYVWVNEKIVCCSQNRPDEREFRADYSFYIAPFRAVIPQANIGDFDANYTRDIFYKRHAHRHGEEENGFIPKRIFYEI